MRTEDIRQLIPDYAIAIIDRFSKNQKQAYIVGGSLRDMMLGKLPNDFDMATSALPEETMEIFSDMRVIATGIKHGTVTVIADGNPVEITTFRVDGSYTDSRHPDFVSFTPDVKEDLARRDFTVNAMAYAPGADVIDPFCGAEDIKKRVLRAVGEPEKRFNEDALRIMRAFRFSAQLGFSIHKDTLSGIERTRSGLSGIARERIATELLKLLISKDPADALENMISLGVMPYVTGEYVPERRVLSGISQMPATDTARLGFFLSSCDVDSARAILHSLKYSNKQITGALAVARGSLKTVRDEADARRFIAEHGVYAGEAIRAAYLLGNSSEEAIAMVDGSRGACRISELEISGRELGAIGFRGKEIGEVLCILMDAVIADPSLNTREGLVSMATELKRTREK